MTQLTTYRSISIQGVSIFYREAGPRDAPTILLLHGLPSSSRMYEPVLTRLSDSYHLVAPDYPGFGHSDWPDPKLFPYTFDHIAELMGAFAEALHLAHYTLYMQDYGGPVGFRMALAHPECIDALIVQNAVAHNEGLGAIWKTRRAYWADRVTNESALRANLLSLAVTRTRHVGSDPAVEHYDPDLWTDEFAFLSRPAQSRKPIAATCRAPRYTFWRPGISRWTPQRMKSRHSFAASCPWRVSTRPAPHPKEPSMSATVCPAFARRFRRVAAGLAASLALGAVSAHAGPMPFPADFRSSQVVAADATIHVRVGGHGPAVVLIHGFGDTGDMWSPMAAELAKDHTVVVPDLRGMGLSSHPASGYDKWTQAGDIRAVLDKLGIDRADIVAHDIGTMVAYAYAARYPDKTTRLVVMDSPIPGIPPWNQIVRLPALWHFNFGGPDAERLVAGRERIYLDRFWNEFAGDPSKIDEATRRHYAALYGKPGAMHSAFAQFLAIGQKDEADNLKAMETKLAMPVLAIGAEKAFGANVAVVMRNAATNVQEVVVPNVGHWLMEEAPTPTIAAVKDFLAAH